MKRGFQIAIDGPVAAGKGVVSKTLAETLGFLYVDTGAMYRAATLLAMKQGLRINSEAKIADLVRKSKIQVRRPRQKEEDGRLSTILLNGEDVTWEIRQAEVTANVAKVARLAKVRQVLVKKQQEIAKNKDVVMEGRDIGSVVLPEADLKIYLDAREGVRVERRFKELIGAGERVTRKEVAERLRQRDRLDSEREASPMRVLPGVWQLDTSDLSVEEVVKLIERKVKQLKTRRLTRFKMRLE